MKSCAVTVIGHVDHGKTSLVRALTGIETDRLKEEKERGLSIALGFAHRDYPSGNMDFIDVPGHEDFVRTMVSGATGAGAALLVVSAVQGVARQTVEHLEIATLLGITRGVVAVTKADLLARSEWSTRKMSIKKALAATCLRGQPIVFCSSTSGEGLDVLDGELDALLRRLPRPPRLPGFFLPVDRVFSSTGVGTVVTGTLLGAGLEPGSQAVVAPMGRSVTVRGLQTHGIDRDFVEAGSRAAVNLRNVSRDNIRPGDVLCAPDCFSSSTQIDIRLTVAPAAKRALKHLDDVRVMHGTHSATATVRLFRGACIEPGESDYAQLRFAAPVIAFVGQRAVLRRLSPVETIGGAIIIDPAASPSRKNDEDRMAILAAAERGDLRDIADALRRRSGGIVWLAELARLGSQTAAHVREALGPEFLDLGAGQIGSAPEIAATKDAYLEQLGLLHRGSPLRSGFPEAQVRQTLAGPIPLALVNHAERRLVEEGRVVRGREGLALAGHDPRAGLSRSQRSQLAAIEHALRRGGLKPPDPDDLRAEADTDPGTGHDLVELLVTSGRAVSLMNHALKQLVVFHVDALDEAGRDLRKAFPFPAQFRTGEAREVLKTTRKYIVPVLERLDAQGLTVRQGDLRHLAEDVRPGSNGRDDV
jgi:selenocysteine-specific elongation factor